MTDWVPVWSHGPYTIAENRNTKGYYALYRTAFGPQALMRIGLNRAGMEATARGEE